jgi:hypothetical protein
MRVVVPFVPKHLSSKTVIALGRSGYEWKRADVSKSDSSYFLLLEKLWKQGGDFCIVEHDIVVGPDTLSGIDACPEPWCVCPFPYLNDIFVGLAVARFRAEIMEAIPKLFDEIAARSTDANHPPRHWCRLAQYVGEGIGSRGFVPHWHEQVGHIGSQMPAHGCVDLTPYQR